MRKYKSKIGTGLVLFLAVVIGTSSIAMIINQVWAGLVVNLAVAAFIVHLFASTYYVIEGEELLVKCGFLISMRIAIGSVSKIAETNNPLSSPATSLDRIAIYYNTSDVVMISPKEKSDFIQHITRINSKIEVILKKTSSTVSGSFS